MNIGRENMEEFEPDYKIIKEKTRIS